MTKISLSSPHPGLFEHLFFQLKKLAASELESDPAKANIVLCLSENILSEAEDQKKIWKLVWANGNAVTSHKEIIAAALSPPHLLEIHLLEKEADCWIILGTAVVSACPGDEKKSWIRIQDRAARLIVRTLNSHGNLIQPKRFEERHTNVIDDSSNSLKINRARLLWRKLLFKTAQIVFHENWRIGWIDAPIEHSLAWRVCPQPKWLTPRFSDKYFADPFPWPKDSKVLLCEEYCFLSGIGKIKRITFHANGSWSEQTEDFGLTGHLSFPFLFTHQDTIYCMPESSADRKLTIFQWQDETGKWLPYSTPLPNIPAADAILFQHGGYFWIAYTDIDINAFDNLNLCFSTSLQGPWIPHPANPVVLDPRIARNGGAVFSVNNRLYRPAQDCSERYGGALRIMEIVECSPLRFVEKEHSRILPHPAENSVGFHTLSSDRKRCLMDAKVMKISPRLLLRKILRRLISSRYMRL